MALTKNDILNGSDVGREVAFDRLGGSLMLYPLTEGQWAQVEDTQMSGFDFSLDSDELDMEAIDSEQSRAAIMAQLKPKVSFDLAAYQTGSALADAMAVAFSLSGSGEQWTPEEVQGMRPIGIIADIAKVVYEISGIQPDKIDVTGAMRESVARFHEEPRGAEDSGAGALGDEDPEPCAGPDPVAE